MTTHIQPITAMKIATEYATTENTSVELIVEFELQKAQVYRGEYISSLLLSRILEFGSGWNQQHPVLLQVWGSVYMEQSLIVISSVGFMLKRNNEILGFIYFLFQSKIKSTNVQPIIIKPATRVFSHCE
jgi:hypothetical protein